MAPASPRSTGDVPPSRAWLAQVRGAGRGTAVTIGSRAIDVVATWGFYALAARALSVDDFGRFVLALTVVQTASVITRLGMEQALLALPPSGGLNRFGASVSGGLSMLTAVAGAAVWLAVTKQLPQTVIWFALALPAGALGQFVIGALRARGRVATAAYAEGIVQPVTAAAFAVVAVLTRPRPESFAIAFLLSWMATLPFAFGVEWRGPAITRTVRSSVLATGRSMLGVVLCHQASASADLLLLGALATAGDVARYATAQKIATAFLLLHAAVTAATTPFMRSLAGQPEVLTSYFRVVTRWTVAAALPLLVVLAGTPQLVLGLFGQEYAKSSGRPLVILAVASMVILLSGPAGSLLLCSGRARELFRVTAGGAIALVVVVALAARFGDTAVAFAMLAGRLIARGMLVAVARRHVTGTAFDGPLFSLVGAGIAGVVVARLTIGLAGNVGAAVFGAFVALALALAVLAREGDVALLRAEMRKP